MKIIAAASLLALTVLPAHALYKVVGPDGRVTYTDRPPVASPGQALSLGASAGAGEAALPLALREPASRFPVVLYTAPDCAPCNAGRDLLRKRGIPYQERAAGATQADQQAWLRQVGSADAPALSVGRQMLHGYSPTDWNTYLDTAGYPGESRLPPGYVQPAPMPLVDAVTPRSAAPARAPEPAPAEPAAAPAGGFRF
jgi:glutaredoxin